MNDIVYGIALIPLIVGLVQAVKLVGLADRFAPLASVGLGLILALSLSFSTGTSIPESVLTGIAFGLAASGLYSGTRALQSN